MDDISNLSSWCLVLSLIIDAMLNDMLSVDFTLIDFCAPDTDIIFKLLSNLIGRIPFFCTSYRGSTYGPAPICPR